LLVLTGASLAQAQNPAADDSSGSIRARIDVGTNKLTLETGLKAPLEKELADLLRDKRNFRIYRISIDNPAAPSSATLDIDSLLADTNPIECKESAASCTSVVLNFKNNLDPANYVVEIVGLNKVASNKTDSLPVFFYVQPPQAPPPQTTATIVSSLSGARDKIRIQSKENITPAPTLTVTNTGYKVSSDSTKLMPQQDLIAAQVEDPAKPNNPLASPTPAKEFTLLLDEGLSKGKTNLLSINSGIIDQFNKPVKTEGSVEIPGLPKAPDKLNFELNLSSEAAVHQKPFFNLAGRYDAQNLISFNDCFISVQNLPCYWQPQITADLGLGNTKSKNSITVDLPFRAIVYNEGLNEFTLNNEAFDDVNETNGEMPLLTYYSWKHTDWHKGAYYLFFGPKFEADRTFGRINALGSVRMDFRLHRLLGSLNQKRSLLLDSVLSGPSSTRITKQQVSQVEIKTGYSLVPTIGIDFGRKVTAEVIEKGNLRQVIPTNSIFRGFAGFKGTYELNYRWLPVSLSLEERLYYLGKEETIGKKTDTGIDIRRVKGFHHRSVLSFDLYLNQVRRYSFNITYENGRGAPDFEYLNKISGGFKVTY
jgi:hypothetical protein